ncbi:MAG: PstS family phosphate ABC transporter substrate-binding protein [Ignavibacteriaceae bacterium]
MSKLILVIIFLFVLLSGCKQGSQEGDGPTFGSIHISVDESFRSVFESQINTFESIYRDTKISVSYYDELKTVNDLLAGSSRLIVLSRELNRDEQKVFEKKQIVPRTTKIAYDGITLITNKRNRDTLLTYDNLLKILNGDIRNWNQLNVKSHNSGIKLIFDSKNSGIIRYLFEKAGIKSLSGTNSYSLNSNQEVLDYVANHPDAIGFISISWISDRDDTTQLSFRKGINVMAISPPDTSKGAGTYYQPYQAYIAQKFYPLWRAVYIISGEARAGLGLGFTGFVASEKGQRIILKSGLVPATMPVRLVEIYNQKIK